MPTKKEYITTIPPAITSAIQKLGTQIEIEQDEWKKENFSTIKLKLEILNSEPDLIFFYFDVSQFSAQSQNTFIFYLSNPVAYYTQLLLLLSRIDINSNSYQKQLTDNLKELQKQVAFYKKRISDSEDIFQKLSEAKEKADEILSLEENTLPIADIQSKLQEFKDFYNANFIAEEGKISEADRIERTIERCQTIYKYFKKDGNSPTKIEELDKFYEDIHTYHDELLGDDTDNESIKSTIENTKQEIEALKDSSKKLKEDIRNAKEEADIELEAMNDYYNKWFITKYKTDSAGNELINDDGEKIIKKLSKETEIENSIQAKEKALATYLEDKKARLDIIEDNITKLANGATALGLATSFDSIVNENDKQVWIFSAIFVLCVVSTMYLLGWELSYIIENDKPFEWKYINKYLPTITLTLLSVWLSLIFNRNLREHRRLKEEYNHKKAVAMTFVGLEKAIKDLPDTSDKKIDLQNKLLDCLITATSHNASQIMDKKHHSDLPLEKVADIMSKNATAMKTIKKSSDFKP